MLSQGMILGKYLVNQVDSNKLNLQGKNILELGSGTGVVSLFAASLGANVWATDIPEVMPTLEASILSNDAVITGGKGKVTSLVLDWTWEKEKVEVALQSTGVKNIDLILAADVIFNPGQLGTFSKFLKLVVELLGKFRDEDTRRGLPTSLLCYKSRHEEIDDEIVETLETLGFIGTQIEEGEMDTEYRNPRIDIFSLTFGATDEEQATGLQNEKFP
eukprot:TRINITY_DN11983_c0_g1_i2.p1 TRINITY_DN11983_c0_g1~~TRINITY_DN11983_c0_g1_i2.p1  ORF type:complete len:217 (+),score=23.16 TRINITY_DN11983_c0_g1_i2:284-934(+)